MPSGMDGGVSRRARSAVSINYQRVPLDAKLDKAVDET